MAASCSFSGEGHQDVVINILSRLPAKSLKRFICVCQSWYTLIKSSYFVTKHLQQSRKSTEEEEAPLFAMCQIRRFRESRISLITAVHNNEIEKTVVLPNSPPFCEGYFYAMTLGPVNGIYCWIKKNSEFVREFDSLFLCNPALREVKAIPKVPRPTKEVGSDYYCCYYLDQKCGFGYDPNANDYKVVAVTEARCDAWCSLLQIFVYTLSSDSWRKLQIEKDNFPAAYLSAAKPVLTDGNQVCHWLASGKHKRRVILSFDFGSETFKSSPLPQGHDGLDYSNRSSLCLSVLNESSVILISMSNLECRNKTGRSEIFIMNNENGSTGKDLWTLLYIVESIPGVRRPLGLQKNGEIIFALSEGTLVTYKPGCQLTEHLHNCPKGFEAYQVCTYVESLISIHGRSGGA